MEFSLNDQNSLLVRFFVDYPSEVRRFDQLAWLAEALHIRFHRSGSIINYRPPYRTTSAIIFRNPHLLDEQWQSVLTWCADNVCDVTKTDEPILVFRIRKPDYAEQEMQDWCESHKLAVTFSGYNVVDANTFDTIELCEFVFEKANDAVFFKLRWSDWLV